MIIEEQMATQLIISPQQKVLIYLGRLAHIVVGTQQACEYLMKITHVVTSGHGPISEGTSVPKAVAMLQTSLSMIKHSLPARRSPLTTTTSQSLPVKRLYARTSPIRTWFGLRSACSVLQGRLCTYVF